MFEVIIFIVATIGSLIIAFGIVFGWIAIQETADNTAEIAKHLKQLAGKLEKLESEKIEDRVCPSCAASPCVLEE
jgi:predicted negative regulator of RcsB-dependent stress response